MSNLLIKEISPELLREVNYAASGCGLTQREWVIQVLTYAVEEKAGKLRETAEPVRKGVTEQTVPAGTGNTPRGSRGAGNRAGNQSPTKSESYKKIEAGRERKKKQESLK